MKRLLALLLIAAMLCLTGGAYVESFLDVTKDFVTLLNDQAYAQGLVNLDQLFTDYIVMQEDVEYIYTSDSVNILLQLLADNSGSIGACCIASETPDTLMLAMNLASFIPVVTHARSIGSDGRVDMDSDVFDSYNTMTGWCESILPDAYSAFNSGSTYTAPVLRTNHFDATLEIMVTDGYPHLLIQYVFETPYSGSAASAPSAASGSMYVVNCQEWVSLRSAARYDAPKLAEVPFGALVTNVSFTGNGFVRCRYNGIDGYIHSNYLSDQPQSAPNRSYSTPYKGTAEQSWPDEGFENMYPKYKPFNGTRYKSDSSTRTVGDYLFSVGAYTYRVVNCTSFVNLREEANAYSDSIIEVPLGERVQVNGELNSWMLCRYNNRYGWIKSGYLQKN